jgi:hypothetical protein
MTFTFKKFIQNWRDSDRFAVLYKKALEARTMLDVEIVKEEQDKVVLSNGVVDITITHSEQ